jgi:cyanate permease
MVETVSQDEINMLALGEPLLPLFNKEEESTAATAPISSFDGSDDETPCRQEEEYILIHDNDDNDNDDPYHLDPRRFSVLAVFCLNNVVSSAEWITFAPIADAVRIKYQISASQVNWLSLIFMLLYGPFTALCAWSIRNFGLRKSVVSNSAVMAVGSLLRWWSCYWIDTNCHFAYFLLLMGQGIVAAGQPVFSNAQVNVASAWFQKTTEAIGASNIAGLVGGLLGQAMSPLFVDEANGTHLDQLLMGQAIAMALCAVATWWSFAEMPNNPPTRAEAMRRRQQQNQQQVAFSSSPSMMQDVWKLSTDPQYLLLTLAFGVGYGLNNATLTLTQPWIAAAGFPGDETAGLCGALTIAGGVLGTCIAAPWLDATKNYNQAVRVGFGVAFLVGVATVAAMTPNTPVWLLATAFAALGMAQFPLAPICLDAAAAHSYPIPEELSSAGLQLVGQYLGIVLVGAMGPLMQVQGSAVGFEAPVNITFLCLCALSSGVALCYKGKDPRAIANMVSGSTTGRPDSTRDRDSMP